MNIKPFHDKNTGTLTYIISDSESKCAAVIDPVLNFDLHSGKITEDSIDLLENFIKQEGLQLDWILETHIHADHLSGANALKGRLGGRIGIGAHIKEVVEYWAPVFNQQHNSLNKYFDHLFTEAEEFLIGEQLVKVIHTPGHTPACICYLIGNNIFVGDTIFAPNLGTSRADFPGGSAKQLFNSIQKIFSLPDNTQIYVGHDYPKEGEPHIGPISVAIQKKENIMLNAATSEAEYIEKRNDRDQTLAAPKLILPSLQVNIRGGQLPEPESNGRQYLKIPLDF